MQFCPIFKDVLMVESINTGTFSSTKVTSIKIEGWMIYNIQYCLNNVTFMAYLRFLTLENLMSFFV
ncbi:MAG: hypothetical protein ACI9MS_001218 [Glaciecola sp.]